MRVLLGPLNRRGHRAVVDDLTGLDVTTFDRADADVRFDPAREPLETLWARLPAGWTPDLLLWWSPEYSLLPEGIERCPVPSVAALGDWNLGLWATAPLLEAFDWVVTDRLGVRVLAPQLGVPVDHWPMFSFDRALHRRDPGRPRDIDVLFVGNLNPEVQDERMPWLARLAGLADRRRVVIAAGVYGEGYADLLRRARIVWNRAIRGELNMRAYEAPASGALLMMEAENLEVRDVFADGVSCALYDATTLERVIDDYLDAPERLAGVAEAGWRRVQSETYRDHVERLLAPAAGLRVGRRPFAELPPWRRDVWLALHAVSAADPARVEAALGHLARALTRTPDRGALAAAVGAVAAIAGAAGLGDAEQSLDQAAELLGAAVRFDPADVVSHINLAWVHAARGRREAAGAEWRAARALLQRGVPFPLDRVPVPFGFDRFRTEWERAAVHPDLEGRAAAFRPLLEARAAAGLARLEADPDTALDWWVRSVEAWPAVDDNVRQLARALESAGQPEAAAEGYARLLDLNPFDWDARAAAARLAVQLGDAGRLERLLGETRRITAAVPAMAGAAAGVEELARPALTAP